MLDINKTDLEMKIKLFEQRTIKNAARQHEWIHTNIWCSRLNDFVKEKSVVFQTFFQQLHGSKERRCRSNNKGIPLWSHRIKILKILYFPHRISINEHSFLIVWTHTIIHSLKFFLFTNYSAFPLPIFLWSAFAFTPPPATVVKCNW